MTAAAQWDKRYSQLGSLQESVLGLPLYSATDAITAKPSGTQATSVLLSSVFNRVTVVATGGDSVLLPLAAPGLSIIVTNATAATSMGIFPAVGDTINALGANAVYALAGTKTVEFISHVAGQWHTLLSA